MAITSPQAANKENPPAAGFLLLVDSWMLVHQAGAFLLQLFNLCINVFNLLLYIIVVFAQDLFRFLGYQTPQAWPL